MKNFGLFLNKFYIDVPGTPDDEYMSLYKKRKFFGSRKTCFWVTVENFLFSLVFSP